MSPSIAAFVVHAFFAAIAPAQLETLDEVLAQRQRERQRLETYQQQQVRHARFAAPLARLRDHELFADMPTSVSDLSFHRTELLGPASLVPDEWMEESCALGSVSRCVESLQRFRAAGADEIVTYGSTPNQNAALADAWRQASIRVGT